MSTYFIIVSYKCNYYCSWAIKIILHDGKFKLFKAIYHKMYVNT